MEFPEIQDEIALEQNHHFLEKDSSLAFDQCLSLLKEDH